MKVQDIDKSFFKMLINKFIASTIYKEYIYKLELSLIIISPQYIFVVKFYVNSP